MIGQDGHNDIKHDAHAAMMVVAAPLAPEDRRRFLTQVPLNRQVEAAMAAKRRHIHVHLVRADAPRGQSLTAADTLAITWTTYSPEDDLHEDAVARRRLNLNLTASLTFP